MLYGLLLTLYVICCLFLVLIILIQKGKSSMGLGGLGGGSQMLFGGSGGQDIFQKITWVLTALFMFGSLTLSLMKVSQSKSFKYVQKTSTPKPLADHTPAPERPAVTIPTGPAQTQPAENQNQ